MPRDAYLMQFSIYTAGVIVMTSFDVIEDESIFFQDSDNFVERPIENPIRHRTLYIRKAVVLHFEWRWDRLIRTQIAPKLLVLQIAFLIQRCNSRTPNLFLGIHIATDCFLQVKIHDFGIISFLHEIEFQSNAIPGIYFLEYNASDLSLFCAIHTSQCNAICPEKPV